jgi:hypothetical protein
MSKKRGRVAERAWPHVYVGVEPGSAWDAWAQRALRSDALAHALALRLNERLLELASAGHGPDEVQELARPLREAVEARLIAYAVRSGDRPPA